MADSRLSQVAYRLSRIAHRVFLPLGNRPLQFGIYFCLALLFLWPLTLHPTFVPFPPGSQYSDLLITHLPNAAYMRDSLARYGQWPLWNAQIVAGRPLAADPLVGMWYPPNLLLLLPGVPLQLAFNALFALHLAWAGYGLFRFLSAEGLGTGAAAIAGLAFMGTPKLFAHLGAGHVSLVFGVAWMPWLLLSVTRAASLGGLRQGAAAGVCLALLFLADARWALYASALAGALWLAGLPRFSLRVEGGRVVRAVLAFTLILLSISAVLALPLAQFVMHSNRTRLTLTEAAAFSLPLHYLIGLLLPNLGGFHEWMTFVGIAPLSLACLGISRRTIFWLATALCSAGFALGSNAVIFPGLIRLLPAVSVLRVPPRAWFITALAVCVLAAFGMDRLTRDASPLVRRWFPLLAFGGAAFAAVLALGAALVVRPYPVNLLLFSMSSVAGLGVLARRAAGTLTPGRALVALALITATELFWVDSTLIVARPLPPLTAAARWIASQPGLFRVYSPSYSLPPGDGLQHADGINPLQLARSVKFIEAASGVHTSGYSTAVPAFGEGEVATANAGAVPDARRLGLLNVKYIAAEFPLSVPELTLVKTFGATRVYENSAPFAATRAWIAGLDPRQADVQAWTPNRIEVRAQGPGLLVLSEVMYPGWQAWVDGETRPIELVEGLLRGVRLGEGTHTVVYEFRSLTVYAGAVLTLLGLAAAVGIWRWAR